MASPQVQLHEYHTCSTLKRMGTVNKKLTITVDEEVYTGLYRVVGPRRISQFIEDCSGLTWSNTISQPPMPRWPATKRESSRRTAGPRHCSRMSPMKRGEVWWIGAVERAVRVQLSLFS